MRKVKLWQKRNHERNRKLALVGIIPNEIVDSGNPGSSRSEKELTVW